MKKIILPAFLLIAFLFSCNHTEQPKNNVLVQSNLTSQLFTINIKKDTTLSTANGAVITIPQGALSGGAGETVQLEIKEAYSMEQIIHAGLTTQSNGRPLSSGGMLYINTVGGQSIKITKAITVKIPTASIDRRMQLFKGDTSTAGTINWKNPDSLSASPQQVAFNKGMAMFSNNCASCHSFNKLSTGPPLAHILARTPDKKLLYDFTRNSSKVIGEEGNLYYQCLYNTWNNTPMNSFTSISDTDLDTLYAFIENESRARNLPFPKEDIRPCIDSCRIYQEIKTKLENRRDKLTKEKVDMVIRQSTSTPPVPVQLTGTGNMPPSVSNKVNPVNNQSLYYQFNIQTFGWYNIDMLLKDAGSSESSLMVRIRGQYKQNISLYLAIPSVKVLLAGGLLQDSADTYGFDNRDGTITLPQDIRAIVFAVGEYEDKIVFDKREFMTGPTQDIWVGPSIVTKQEFETAAKSLSMPDIHIGVNSTPNADTLRKIIQEVKDVEKIKPIRCNCNCGIKKDTTQSAPEAVNK